MSMDQRVKELNKDQQIALARLVSDLVRADKFIDDKEIKKFNNLFGGLNEQIFFNAQKVPFAQALKQYLSTKSSAKRENAKNILKEISESDGICDPNEAHILMAFQFMLTGIDSDIESYKITNHSVSGKFVIYTEPSSTDNMSREEIMRMHEIRQNIEDNYEIISHLFGSMGFQFLFIPAIATMYAEKSKEAFEDMVKYVFAIVDKDTVDEIYEKITKMTVKKFSKDYLGDKMGISCNNECPELLMMIGKSEVLTQGVEKYKVDEYINVIKLKLIDADVHSKVDRIVNMYNRIISYNNYFTFNPSHHRLVYRGVFKLFFNLVARPLSTANDWTFNLNTGHASNVMSINNISSELNATQAALYLTILFTTFYGDKKGLPISSADLTSEQIELYDKIYSYCYFAIKGKATKQPASVFNRVVTTHNDINKVFKRNKKVQEIVDGISIREINKHYKISLNVGVIKINGELFEKTILYQKLSKMINC